MTAKQLETEKRSKQRNEARKMLTSLLCHASCRSFASGNARDIPGPLEKMRAFATVRSGFRNLVRAKIPH